MSSTNKTPNYNLPQFINNDKPSWLTDINQAFNDIDLALKTNKDNIDASEEEIDGISARLNATDINVTNLQTASSQHGADITDLKAQDIIIKNDITNLQNNKANVVDTEYNVGDSFTVTASDNLLAVGLAVSTSRIVFTIPLDKTVEASNVNINSLRLWVKGVNGTILNSVLVSDDSAYTITPKINQQGISIDLTHNAPLPNMVANTPVVVTVGGTVTFN